METKSRYEVIAELEQKKRDLINQRDNLVDEQNHKELEIRNQKRQIEDTNIVLKRKLDDAEDDLKRFIARLEDRKETINELVKSVDDSLERFNKLSQK